MSWEAIIEVKGGGENNKFDIYAGLMENLWDIHVRFVNELGEFTQNHAKIQVSKQTQKNEIYKSVTPGHPILDT